MHIWNCRSYCCDQVNKVAWEKNNTKNKSSNTTCLPMAEHTFVHSMKLKNILFRPAFQSLTYFITFLCWWWAFVAQTCSHMNHRENTGLLTVQQHSLLPRFLCSTSVLLPEHQVFRKTRWRNKLLFRICLLWGPHILDQLTTEAEETGKSGHCGFPQKHPYFFPGKLRKFRNFFMALAELHTAWWILVCVGFNDPKTCTLP